MRLYHVTPVKNRDSILRKGIQCAYARTVCNCVWLCTRKQLELQVAHVMRRHSCTEVAIFYLARTANQLHRVSDGVYFARVDILPETILGELMLPTE